MKKIIDLYDKFVKLICNILAVGTGTLIVFIMLLIMVDICMRTFFNSPVRGATEIVEFCAGMAAFMALPITTYKGMHIGVRTLLDVMPKWLYITIETITSVAGLCIVPIFFTQMFNRMLQAVSNGESSSVLKFPMQIVFFVCFLGYVGLFFAQLLAVIRAIRGEGYVEKKDRIKEKEGENV